MMKYILNRQAVVLLLLMLVQVAGRAQKDVFITHKGNPETSSLMLNVSGVDFHDGVAAFRTGDGVKEIPVGVGDVMGWKEMDSRRSQVIPESLQPLFDFEVAFMSYDHASASVAETEVTDEKDSRYEDFVEHSEWQHKVTVTFGGTEAVVEDEDGCVDVVVEGNHVVISSECAGVEYRLKGKSDNGSLKLYGAKKAKMVLDGVELTNPKGAAINNQCKKRLFLVLNEGTENRLSDGAEYEKSPGEDQRGCLFSEGQVCVSGSGSLFIDGNHKNGIASDDYLHVISGFVQVVTHATKGDAVKAKSRFEMGGGVLQAMAEGDAAKGVKTDSLITVSGGRLTVIVTGDAVWEDEEQDYSSACGLKCDRMLTLSGGEIRVCATGSAGKGMSAGTDNKTGDDVVIDGAEVFVRTAGQRVSIDPSDPECPTKSSPKGIKASHNIIVRSGSVTCRCSGGNGAEGLEAKHDSEISGGTVRSYCFDDGLNAVNSKLMGGDVFVCSTDNDGYDCNGGINISGGKLYAIGAPGNQAGIDNDGKTFQMLGGQVVGVGGYSSTPWDSKSNQASILCYVEKNVRYLALEDESGSNIITVRVADTYNPLGVLISHQDIQVGKKYKVVSFNTLTSGEEYCGVVENAVYADAVVEYEFTVENLMTTLGTKKKY